MTDDNRVTPLPGLADRAEREAHLPNDGIHDALIRDLPPNYLLVPSKLIPVTYSAERMFSAMANQNALFRRGNALQRITNGELDIIPPAAFVSFAESFGQLCEYVAGNNGGRALRPSRLDKGKAELILSSKDSLQVLKQLDLILDVPLCVEVGGKLVDLHKGYNEVGNAGVWVKRDLKVTATTLEMAVEMLKGLLVDFQWKEPADLSRAIAALLTPACCR